MRANGRSWATVHMVPACWKYVVCGASCVVYSQNSDKFGLFGVSHSTALVGLLFWLKHDKKNENRDRAQRNTFLTHTNKSPLSVLFFFCFSFCFSNRPICHLWATMRYRQALRLVELVRCLFWLKLEKNKLEKQNEWDHGKDHGKRPSVVKFPTNYP